VFAVCPAVVFIFDLAAQRMFYYHSLSLHVNLGRNHNLLPTYTAIRSVHNFRPCQKCVACSLYFLEAMTRPAVFFRCVSGPPGFHPPPLGPRVDF